MDEFYPVHLMIGNQIVSRSERPRFVAEISANHGHSYENLKETVQSIRDCSFDFAKIQIFDPSRMAHPGAVVKQGRWAGQRYEDLYRKTALSEDLQKAFFELCHESGLSAFASVFHPADIDRALRLGSCALKIASPEITNIPLIKEASQTGLPVLVSLGCATRSNMMDASEVLDHSNNPWMFIHCTSEYPCAPQDARLGNIPILETIFDRVVGFSDHTLGTWASTVAITLGARLIEKHFIASPSIRSEDAIFSITPHEAARMINEGLRAVQSSHSFFPPEDQVIGSHYRCTEKDGVWARGE